jgi:hypothetical protein
LLPVFLLRNETGALGLDYVGGVRNILAELGIAQDVQRGHGKRWSESGIEFWTGGHAGLRSKWRGFGEERPEMQAAGVKQAAEKDNIPGGKLEKHTSGAESRIDWIDFIPGINPRPTARMSFSAAYKARIAFWALLARPNNLRKMATLPAKSLKSIPQGLKPKLI